jgi:hypothetical protein
MSLRFSFLISLLILCFILFFGVNSEIKIDLETGESNLTVVSDSNSKDKGVLESNSKPNQEGVIQEEIFQIKNKILYPKRALEENLEDECIWALEIDSNSKLKNIKKIKKCKFEIFEEEFLRVIYSWEFKVTNTELVIPVKFRIQN